MEPSLQSGSSVGVISVHAGLWVVGAPVQLGACVGVVVT